MPSCPICHSQQTEQTHASIRYLEKLEVKSLPHKCSACSLVFLYPQMNDEQESRFYRHDFRNMFHGKEYDIKVFHERAKIEAGRRRDMIFSQTHGGQRLVDVGSSSGAFLDSAKERLAEVCGVEPDERQRGFANELGLQTMPSMDELSGKFDIATLFHVLEHIREPTSFLKKIRERLAPGGRLYVEVPNADDILLSYYKIPGFAEFYFQPAHVYYFSRRTLNSLLTAAGFREVAISPLQRYGMENHLRWLNGFPPASEPQLRELFSPATRDAYRKDLERNFLTDTLWAVAQG